MKEHPIIFKPQLVRAIIDGHKTQTRRVVKGEYQGLDIASALPEPWLMRMCPYGGVGDTLWVRENWSTHDRYFEEGDPIRYQADGGQPLYDYLGKKRWRPSIHLPRIACRLTLTVTEIRVQRLHDISEEDAIAEGINLPNYADEYVADMQYPAPSEIFMELWEKINGKESLDSNPWVWAITFEPAILKPSL